MWYVFFLFISCFLHQGVYCSQPTENTELVPQKKPKPVSEWTNDEREVFGKRCRALPTAWWLKTLDFLLGPRHIIAYDIDPKFFSDLRQSNKAKIDNEGRLLACRNNIFYWWNLHGMTVLPDESWRTYAVPQGWAFDRFENESVVIMNKSPDKDSPDTIQTFDDLFFKEQDQYRIPKNSLFWIANHTLVHCSHPLITKAPVTSVSVICNSNSKIVSRKIPMPPGGVMQPFALDRNGTLFAAHDAERDVVYEFSLKKPGSVQEIVLSDRAVSMETNHAVTWQLRNPATYAHERFVMALANNPLSHSTQNTVFVESARISVTAPFLPLNFLQIAQLSHGVQKGDHMLGELSFVGDQSKNSLQLVSLSTAVHREADEKEKKSMRRSYAIDYRNACTGEKSYSLTSKKKSAFTYATGCSGQLVLCDNTGCYTASPRSGRQLLMNNCQGTPHLTNVLMSPSGMWILHYDHVELPDKTYVLLAPKIFYLGGEKMKKIAEDPKIAGRKWLMGLYARQRASELGQPLQPPLGMQKALGMIKSKEEEKKRYSSSKTGAGKVKQKGDCRIS